jgi:cytochrome c oxidase subunit IV
MKFTRLDPEKESLILNGMCGLLALVAIAIAVWAPLSTGINIDNLFLSVLCLSVAAVFAINPILTFASGGAFKELMTSMKGTEAAVPAGSHKTYYLVWGGLLALTIVEILLIFPQLKTSIMLVILVGLSLIKSALIVAYFMHLKFERMSFVLTIIPITIVLIALFAVFFPDSFRSLNLGSYK